MEADPQIEKNREVMEDIWKRLPKETVLPPSLKGEYIRYVATDPKYLHMTGFVDTRRYTEEEWAAAFDDCRQPDGSYLLSKDKFISLGQYKYSGAIKKPLDPMKIREGWYEADVWHQFCVKSIIPSTTITVEQLVQIEKEMKKVGRIVNGRIQIDKTIKLQIKQILDTYPSSARRRELGVQTAYEKLLKEEALRSTAPVSQKAAYVKGAKLGDTQKKELKDTLMKSAQVKPKAAEEKPTLSLKDLRKKSSTKKQPL